MVSVMPLIYLRSLQNERKTGEVARQPGARAPHSCAFFAHEWAAPELRGLPKICVESRDTSDEIRVIPHLSRLASRLSHLDARTQMTLRPCSPRAVRLKLTWINRARLDKSHFQLHMESPPNRHLRGEPSTAPPVLPELFHPPPQASPQVFPPTSGDSQPSPVAC
jgi:hypothetical protein